MPKRKQRKGRDGISRREFARKAMLTATAAALPSSVLGQSAGGAEPKPAAAQAEADRAFASVLARYGDRLTEAQKNDLRNVLTQQQKSLETLRAFSLDNGVQPATVLRVRAGRS